MDKQTTRATKKQQQLLEFVRSFIEEHDYGPSYREIMTGLGYKSVSTVAAHVEGLVAKGYLNRRDSSARSLEVAVGAPRVSTAPHSVIVEEITSRLKTPIDKTDRETLLRALDLLGYEAARKRLEEEYATTEN